MTQQRQPPAPVHFGRNHQIRVLLVDDHKVLRQALQMLLASQDGIEIVGDAINGRDAIDLAKQLRPDVVLMDAVMPGLSGIEATREIVRRAPGTRVVILSAYLDEDLVLQALRAGAMGYVHKRTDLAELMLAIQSVRAGKTYFSADVTAAIAVGDMMMRLNQPVTNGYELLSVREREVLQEIAEGMSNQSIAVRLSISVKTVEAHRAHLITKLHSRNRTDLIWIAIKHGLIGTAVPEFEHGWPRAS